MPKAPVRVFWRGVDGNECVLRSTDQGWEVAVVAKDGQPVRKERVSGSKEASLIAERWRRSDATPDT